MFALALYREKWLNLKKKKILHAEILLLICCLFQKINLRPFTVFKNVHTILNYFPMGSKSSLLCPSLVYIYVKCSYKQSWIFLPTVSKSSLLCPSLVYIYVIISYINNLLNGQYCSLSNIDNLFLSRNLIYLVCVATVLS